MNRQSVCCFKFRGWAENKQKWHIVFKCWWSSLLTWIDSLVSLATESVQCFWHFLKSFNFGCGVMWINWEICNFKSTKKNSKVKARLNGPLLTARLTDVDCVFISKRKKSATYRATLTELAFPCAVFVFCRSISTTGTMASTGTTVRGWGHARTRAARPKITRTRDALPP